MQHPVKAPKKLIEVALPLDAINLAARDEKAVPRPGHPQTLHYWWARRPLAAARAVILGQMVNDPSWKWELDHPEQVPPNNLKASWAASRKRIFSIIEDVVKWENTTNEEALGRARAEIRKSWLETCELNSKHPRAKELFDPERLPAFHDPFAGGGALPLEAQRLGLEAHASDLNPVAVLINKAMIEIPHKFHETAPVNPEAGTSADMLGRQWPGAQGLAEDVRFYGGWMQEEAQRRIGHLYPPIVLTTDVVANRTDLASLVGKQLPIIAWLWTRTVKSPDPAFRHVQVPLASTYVLASKAGKSSYVHPVVEGDRYHFSVLVGEPPAEALAGAKLARANFRCLLSGAPISGDYIKAEGRAGRMGVRLMAVVAEGHHGRVYLPPTDAIEASAWAAKPEWSPDVEFFQQALGFRVGTYGLTKWSDLFTDRQLVALSTFTALLQEVHAKVERAAADSGHAGDGKGINTGGRGARAYADAVCVYLSCALSRMASYNNAICHWNMIGGSVAQIFSRNAIPMSWDFIEVSPLQKMSGNWAGGIEWVSDVFKNLVPGMYAGYASQANASTQTMSRNCVVSTDPPYYDNIGYADLSDFFYVWLRAALKGIFPDLFATVTVPKAEELVATPERHGGKKNAETFFLTGMTQAMHRLAEQAHPAFPVTIYYAFKQAESDDRSGTASTGWETFLDAVMRAGFATSGTWPMRTEKQGRMRENESNALASSIVLVCRKRADDAQTTSRRAFQRELNMVLPEALDEMTKGSGEDRSPVAPVDLSQAIIGPGMAVFSKHAAVLEADGTPMSVRTALQLINRFLAEDDFDHDTQFGLRWFEGHGWKEGKFGEADTLARAKGTSVDAVKQSGVVFAAGGVVRLVKWVNYPTEWSPTAGQRLPVWEVLHQLIRVFKIEGEVGAGALLASVSGQLEATRQLAYRLYTLCERSGWSEDARAYNEIISSWSAIESAAVALPSPKQATLFG